MVLDRIEDNLNVTTLVGSLSTVREDDVFDLPQERFLLRRACARHRVDVAIRLPGTSGGPARCRFRLRGLGKEAANTNPRF